ncbi:hypothetical protein OIU78_013565 [Salix suchowensis]|nr:hypothetical protein OIU78_013565 [Salix suchowensis]
MIISTVSHAQSFKVLAFHRANRINNKIGNSLFVMFCLIKRIKSKIELRKIASIRVASSPSLF